jgi:hypothetical protein
MISGTVAISAAYDNRISCASDNTTFALDGYDFRPHQHQVETSTEFLARLKAAGATQEQIGKVLGIAQSNAATFYTPGKNGKLRKLKWDEGAKLAKAFNLGLPKGESVIVPVSAETIAPILDALLPMEPQAGRTDQSVEALSGALAYGLRLLAESGASLQSADALRVAAHGAVSRFRDLSKQ